MKKLFSLLLAIAVLVVVIVYINIRNGASAHSDVSVLPNMPTETQETAPLPENKSPLGEWVWLGTEFINGTVTTAPSGRFVLSLGSDMRMASTTDCNQLSGGFVLDGEILSIGPIGATKMACMGDTLEGQYSEELSRVTSYSIVGSELRLNLIKDSGTMVFVRPTETN